MWEMHAGVPGPPAARNYQGGVGDAAYAEEIANQLDSGKLWRAVYGSSGRYRSPICSSTLNDFSEVKRHRMAAASVRGA